MAHPCIECGEADPAVLEFDHVRGEKRSEVTKLMRDGYTLKIIQAEIEKCVVLCANCHKRKTYKDSWRDQK
ncbi:MAG: HNH endonuclease [Ardenticatenaceae bacterium]|nr:HNH endonuclease [Anaerolineales bacterium]MCB8941341.1 HNH endonuclease [Ardenticatenaceae bacterium]MCB8972697.1 HNH endonuclease [Ardenticatenaceae bacterium]